MRWPLTFALATSGIAIVFYFAPDADQDWVWVTPGSIATTLLWVVFSLVFRLYVTTVGDYAATYGALAGAAILLLWLYFSGTGAADRRRAEQRDRARGQPRAEDADVGRRKFKAFARKVAESSGQSGNELPHRAV